MRYCIALVGLAWLAAACRDNPPVAPAAPLSSVVPKGSVQVLILQDRRFGNDSAVFVVHVVGNEVPVASFQGEVTFTRGTLQFLSATTGEDSAGEFRLVNSADATDGRIRFAGFSTGEFARTEAFRFVARVTNGLPAANLSGALQVAGEVAGGSVRADLLRQSDGVRDAVTNRLLIP